MYIVSSHHQQCLEMISLDVIGSMQIISGLQNFDKEKVASVVSAADKVSSSFKCSRISKIYLHLRYNNWTNCKYPSSLSIKRHLCLLKLTKI